MASSFVVYIESSTGLNFTVLASSSDDICSLKKKAEAQHLALSPQHGRIFVQDIKMIIYLWDEDIPSECNLPDDIPVRCLFNGAKGIVSLVITTRDSPVLAETRNLCQNASSDSFLIYIDISSMDYKSHTEDIFASSDDDISSIKKKVAAKHLARFPEDRGIVAWDIRTTHEGNEYSLPDNIPVHRLFDGAMGIRILWMDAVKGPPDSAETRADVLDVCQNASSDSYVIYIRMSSEYNYAVLVSSDDNISLLKKKAEAQYLALFSWSERRIVAQAIKITHEGKEYFLPDNIPVSCLFDEANNKAILSFFMDAVTVPLDSTESPTHVLNLCPNAGSDSFLIYIRSLSDLNFAVLASFDDNISSLKKKAAAQHLALFPHDGRIVSQAIKIIHELHKMHGRTYIVPDDIPVRCLFDVANTGIRLLYMDAVTVPVDLAETCTHVLDLFQNGDPSSGRDKNCSLNQNHRGNTNSHSTSEALKRKSPGDNTNKDPVVAEALKRKSPDAVSADMVVLDSAHEGNGSYNEKQNNKALEKKARKEVGYTGLTTHAVMVPDELRCCRTNGSRWHCSEKAMPNSKFCTRHFPCKSTSKKKQASDIGASSSES